MKDLIKQAALWTAAGLAWFVILIFLFRLDAWMEQALPWTTR